MKIKILFVAAVAAALFSCKKDESVVSKDNGEFWVSGKTLVAVINGIDTVTSKNANAVLSGSDNDCKLELNNILNGYKNLALKCVKNGEDLRVDTTSLWEGGRKVYVTGKLIDNVLTLAVSDIHASAFAGKKWMIGEMLDQTNVTYEWGYKKANQMMPAIRLNTTIDTLYLPYVSGMLTGKTDGCAINVKELLNNYAAFARAAYADGNPGKLMKSFGNNDEPKPSTNYTALIDYIEFNENGKFGICVTDRHAHDYYYAKEVGDNGALYKKIDSLAWKYAVGGDSLYSLVDANDPHCILNYYEGVGSWSSKPMIFVSTGFIGGTVIDMVNTVLGDFMGSTLRIDAETINIPVEIFEASSDKLVIGISLSTLIPVVNKIADEVEKCTWEQFSTQYFPGINELIKFAIPYAKKMLGTSSGPTIEEILSSMSDFQINEDLFNIVKPVLVSLLRVVSSLDGFDVSAEIEFIPYKKELRPWEYHYED